MRGFKLKSTHFSITQTIPVNFHGFNIQSYLWQPIAELLFKESKAGVGLKEFSASLKNILKLIFLEYSSDLDVPRSSPIAFIETQRSDARELFDAYLDRLSEYNFQKVHKDDLSLNFWFSLNPCLAFRKIHLLFMLLFRLRQVPLNKLNILNLVEASLDGFNLYFFIKKSSLIQDSGICLLFYDAAGMSNILANSLRYCKVKTFTVQHGVPLVNKEGREALPDVVFKNIVSDVILTWGEFSGKCFKKLTLSSSDRVKICGHPKSPMMSLDTYSYIELVRRVYIFTSQKRWREQNIQLIKQTLLFAKKRGFECVIKMHPSDNEFFYREHFPNSDLKFTYDAIDNIPYEQSIATFYHSTVYYLVMARGVPCFRYKDDDLNIFPGPADMFTSSSELGEVFDKTSLSLKQMTYAQYYTPYLDYVFGGHFEKPVL